jgi:hypothetical protein
MIGKDIWTLILNNKHKDAWIAACEQLTIYNNTKARREKIAAGFFEKRYRDIIEESKILIQNEKEISDRDFINLGIAYWALNDINDAINSWEESKSAKYVDIGGAVESNILLLFAGLMTNNELVKKEALNYFNELAKDKSLAWPLPLAKLISGAMDDNGVIKTLSDIAILKSRQQCQLHFVLALKAFMNGNLEMGKVQFQQSLNQGPFSYLESLYYLSEITLKKL